VTASRADGIDATVAIATIDRPHGLARCVAAVLSGARLPRELVIVDQSRGDATAALVAAAGWERIVHLQYVRSDRRGLGASRNAAVAQATTPTVVFTDDDCVPHHRWLAAIAAAFASADASDLVTGRVLPLEAAGANRHAVATRTRGRPTQFRGLRLPWSVGTGGNAAIRRDWLERVGGFDERLGTGSPGQSAEDMDIFYRLLRAGASARYEPAAVVFHERQDRQGMRRRARSYGFGMGAFCAMRARVGEAYALWIAARWCADRARMLAATCCRGQWYRAADEIRMVRSAGRGIAYGLALGRAEETCSARAITAAPDEWYARPERD
jgi:GT2 family glycosyltransferase